MPLIDAVIRSRRRTIGLHITSEAELVVRAPVRASLRSIKELVTQKRDWILNKKALMRHRLQERPATLPKSFVGDYKMAAQQVIASRVRVYAARMGVTPGRVRVNGARRRWGSCSHYGHLNFSYRLLFAPLPVIDYVVVHELSHMRHLNHSRAFWNEVGRYLPDFRNHHRWLKEHGHRL